MDLRTWALATLAGLGLGCTKSAPPKEFKVQLFCRQNDGFCDPPSCVSAEAGGYAVALAANAREGWSYVGQLGNNGINCTYIAFAREAQGGTPAEPPPTPAHSQPTVSTPAVVDAGPQPPPQPLTPSGPPPKPPLPGELVDAGR